MQRMQHGNDWSMETVGVCMTIKQCGCYDDKAEYRTGGACLTVWWHVLDIKNSIID